MKIKSIVMLLKIPYCKLSFLTYYYFHTQKLKYLHVYLFPEKPPRHRFHSHLGLVYSFLEYPPVPNGRKTFNLPKVNKC